MKNLDLNKYGVQEMNVGEMELKEGGYIDPRVYTGEWDKPIESFWPSPFNPILF